MIKTAYYSYWSKGHKKPDKFLMASQKLSLNCAKKHFDRVHFVTDSAGREHFKELPFDTVSTELDTLDPAYGDAWCLGKLVTYKTAAERGEPFLHIDYDVYLWPQFRRELLESELLAQHDEGDMSYVFYNVPVVLANCPKLYLLENVRPLNAINTGVLGGKNCEFLAAYAEEALAFLLDPANRKFWTSNKWLDPRGDNIWQKTCVSEQYYLEAFRRHREKTITYVLPRDTSEKNAREAGYTHLLMAKWRPDVKEKVMSLAAKINYN